MPGPRRLADIAPELELTLTCAGPEVPALFALAEIRRETTWVLARDGVRLATDVYLPPLSSAPTLTMRTPYGRAAAPDLLKGLASHGFVVVSQDCRGTGDSEPDTWDMFMYEREDSLDCVAWVSQQSWYNGFIGSIGGSYIAATQWAMARHPRMSAIAPEVGGLCVSRLHASYYMFVNAFSRTVGKGVDKEPLSHSDMEARMLPETLAGGYFNQPLRAAFREPLLERYPHLRSMSRSAARRWLWERFCALDPAQRVELLQLSLGVTRIDYQAIWDFSFLFDLQSLPGWVVLPSPSEELLAESVQAPALIITGWYDWGLFETLASWQLLMRAAPQQVTSRSHLVITPNAHNMPGYHEDRQHNPRLQINHRQGVLDLRLRWYTAFRDQTPDTWPRVMYFLMGANEWVGSTAWPPPETKVRALYLGPGGTLTPNSPREPSTPDHYRYDPTAPTPTVGGSIVSCVYPPGSVDVSEVQRRTDVVTYTTAVLDRDLDVVGPLRLLLYASSSAVDTDFSARISDVFPDGRAIQLQAGIFRARYRNPGGEPELLEPGRVYCFEIDLWATANRFKVGHCLRLDISSADFPRFDRNSNCGGAAATAIRASQTLYHDPVRPSHLLLPVLEPDGHAVHHAGG